MRTWFQKLIDLSSVSSTEESLKQALPGLVRELGFDCYAYLNVQPVRTYAVSNYAAEWQARYLARDYTRVDPVVAMARAKMEAFTWAASSPRQAASKTVKAFTPRPGTLGSSQASASRSEPHSGTCRC